MGSAVFGVTKGQNEAGAEWHAFYLLPQWIGCGVGRAFYQRIEEEMIDQGCKSSVLEVLSANKRAIRFYCTHNYIQTGTFAVQENGMTLCCDKMEKER